jgi:hypothetical protein
MALLPIDIDTNWQDGVLVTSTFDAWRKKTNGIIEAYNTGSLVPDGSVTPVKLSTGGPAWTSGGVLTVTDQLKAKSLAVGSTYSQFTVSQAGVVVAFNSITGTSLNTAGAVSANSLAIGTSNNKFTVSSTGIVVSANSITATTGSITATAGSVTGTSLSAGTGTITGGAITGTSLNAGSGLITTTGAVNANSLAIATNKFTVSNVGAVIAADEVKAKSLAIGTNNTQFTVSAAGAIVAASSITATSITGTSLSAGSGSITGASLNVGAGAITSGAIIASGAITAVSFNSTSSLRYKQNIQPLCNALNIIEKLQGVTFDWKETGKSDIGLIAEQVNNVVPEFVLKDQEGLPQAVDYGKLTSILIEAVKELSALVKSQH